MKDVAITFDMHEHGWATVTLRVGDASIALEHVSRLTDDPIARIIGAALSVAQGYDDRVELYDEPGTWRIDLWFDEARSSPAELSIRVSQHLDTMTKALTGWSEVFESSCDVQDFARAVRTMINRVQRAADDERHARVWGKPFPLRQYEALNDAVTSLRRA